MSTAKFLMVIALGSAVGDAMFYPLVPLLHAKLVITWVVGPPAPPPGPGDALRLLSGLRGIAIPHLRAARARRTRPVIRLRLM